MNIENIANTTKRNAKVIVNFKNKICCLKIKGKLIPVEIDELEKVNMKEVMENIENLYAEYQMSTPIELGNTYFKAKAYEEMTQSELNNAKLNNNNRKYAMAKLELYILAMILNGSFKWAWSKNWFWQSENNRDLVLLKHWFE